MPHERTLLSATPPTPETWLAALRSVVPDGVVQVLPGTAAQLVDTTGVVLATVVLPREVSSVSEAQRLFGIAEPDRPWWSEIVAPVADERLDAVLAAIAAQCDGLIA